MLNFYKAGEKGDQLPVSVQIDEVSDTTGAGPGNGCRLPIIYFSVS